MMRGVGLELFALDVEMGFEQFHGASSDGESSADL
jgi:hypothetical protein